VPIPKFQETMLPLLQYLEDGKEHSLSDINEHLASYFKLTDEEKTRPKPSGGQALFRNRWGWGRFELKKAGLVITSSNADTKITQEGLKVLKQKPDKIDRKFLFQIPKYADFIKSMKEKQNEKVETPSLDIENRTPEDLMIEGYNDIKNNLKQEILEKINQGSPSFFELLVVTVFEKMGYGKGTVTGRTGDGGIDGILSGDKLGLDEIYLQAKKWNVNVSRPEINKFAGSLLDKKSKKGIFITTSDFSNEAREYVKKIDTKIILINGEELADLMFEYNVGFNPGDSYQLKKIDEDFFSV